jgi:hypothetical protein
MAAHLIWLMMVLGAASPPSVQEMSEALAAFSDHSHRALPTFTLQDLERLRKGEVLRTYTPPNDAGVRGSLGLLLTQISKEKIWIGLRDRHLRQTEGLREETVGGPKPFGAEIWLGILTLPRPVSPRHWRVFVQNNLKMARATDGRNWERKWHLDPNGEAKNVASSPEELDGAVYLPENQGSYFVIELQSGWTLLGYRTTTQVGGFLPDGLVRRFALIRMEGLLREIVEAAERSADHYVKGHMEIHGGDGRPLLHFLK